MKRGNESRQRVNATVPVPTCMRVGDSVLELRGCYMCQRAGTCRCCFKEGWSSSISNGFLLRVNTKREWLKVWSQSGSRVLNQ